MCIASWDIGILLHWVKEENPYVLGAFGCKEWNDRYMNMATAIRNWQIAFCAALVICIILVLALTKVVMRVKVQPYIVETNKGMPYAIHPMEKTSINDQRLINFAMNQFILNARSVLQDVDAETLLLNKVYAYSANNTIHFLRRYYEINNPFQLVNQYTVSVNILSSMPIGKYTWQIVWDEIKHSLSGGHVLETSRWIANLHYQFGRINQHFLHENPFGLYVTELSWSKTQL